MTSSPSGTIILWTLALWSLGWLTLPLSRRIFAGLPDGGLAAGRVLFLVLVALGAFWGAAAHVVPLRLAPVLAIVAALFCAWNWRDAELRVWARENWRGLLVSDAIFLLGWAAFLWIRLRHPEINDLEKPMDAALLSAAWKTDWLPFAHPWWGGANFTNYYYFGPLMGAGLGRALNTPPHVAYNLVQPAFCAFFLSSVWALGAALTRSKGWGIAVMLLVGLSGTLEPLRQWSQRGWSWPFDWWTTSRVIPDTINEYPAFTMAIGDAHAHFYALSFAALWLSLAWSLFENKANSRLESSLFQDRNRGHESVSNAGLPPSSNRQNVKAGRYQTKRKTPRLEEGGNPAFDASRRRAIIIIGGLVLGAWLMTNTWDAPIFGLLFGLAIYYSRPSDKGVRREIALSILAPFVIAIVAAALYFWKFKSPVGGVKFDAWVPAPLSFGLLWGGWIVLGALAFALPATANDNSARFRRLLIGVGLLALVAPFLFYIKGAFGDGDLRHQDTVFKFGLQAWVLLGLGISAELGARLLALAAVPRFVVAFGLLLMAPVLALAPATTIWTRAITQNTGEASLNGMRYLPLAEQRALVWLQRNGRPREIVMEGVPLGESGSPVGDYDANSGRVGAFSGLSSTLGWPQHVWGWDGNYGEVMERGQRIAALYGLPSAIETARGATELGARYTFFGRVEGNWQAPGADEARAAGFAVHEFAGDDGSRALILERIGR